MGFSVAIHKGGKHHNGASSGVPAALQGGGYSSRSTCPYL